MYYSLQIQGFDETKKKIYFTHNEENNRCNIVHVLMFQQLLADKYYRLLDSKFGREEVWISGHFQDDLDFSFPEGSTSVHAW